MTSATVVVADAQRLFAEALAGALQDQGEVRVVPECPTTGQLAVEVAAANRADVVLLDYWIRGMSGPAATRAMLQVLPTVKVVFLAGFYVGHCQRHEAAHAGALGFIKKQATVGEVVSCIRVVSLAQTTHEGGEYGPRETQLERFFTLTYRELEILQMLGTGLPAKELAAQFSVSVGTLKNHISKIVAKVGVGTQLEAVKLAVAEGIVPPWTPPSPAPTLVRLPEGFSTRPAGA